MSASCRWVCSWSPSESIAMVNPVLKPPGLPTDTDHLQTSPSSSPFSPPLPSIPDTGLHRTCTIHVWSAAGQTAAVCISPCLISVRQRWSFWHTMSLCLRQSVIQTRRLVWARMQSICSVDRALGSCVRIQSGRRNAHIHIYLMLLQTHTCTYIHTATQLTGLNTIRERSVTQPVNRFLQKPCWLNGSFYLGRASWLLLITSYTHTETPRQATMTHRTQLHHMRCWAAAATGLRSATQQFILAQSCWQKSWTQSSANRRSNSGKTFPWISAWLELWDLCGAAGLLQMCLILVVNVRNNK